MDKNTNLFITALTAPFFILGGAVAVVNGDMLIIFLFFAVCFGILSAYVTEFPLLNGLYLNELAHKTAISAMVSMFAGFLFFLLSYVLTHKEDAGTSGSFSASSFIVVWAGLAIPAYLMMIFLVSRLNKRDLEAEQAIRDEKKKKNKSSGPPILNKDGGGL